MTAPSELLHASLSCDERKKKSTGYERWLSSTSAVQFCHVPNVATSCSGMWCLAQFSSNCTPDGGAPASASSATTAVSRRWNALNSENSRLMTSAKRPKPLAASTAPSTCVAGAVASMPPAGNASIRPAE